MTLPGSITNALPRPNDWVARELRDLRKELQLLKGARRLEHASVSDPVTGAVMPVGVLAFGMRSASVPGADSWNIPSGPTSGIYWAPGVATPEVEVSTPNGKILVLGWANMTARVGNPVWSIEARRPDNSVAVARWDGTGDTPHQTADPGLGEGAAMPGAGLVDLPGPGDYKIRMVFGTTYVGGAGQTGGCHNRTLIVFPY